MNRGRVSGEEKRSEAGQWASGRTDTDRHIGRCFTVMMRYAENGGDGSDSGSNDEDKEDKDDNDNDDDNDGNDSGR